MTDHKKITVDLGGLGPFPFKNCPKCERRWPLASFRGVELCFRCTQEAVQ